MQELIKEKQLDALVIDYLIDLYYLTGKKLSLGRLVVTPQEAILFVDGRYYEACRQLKQIEAILTSGYGKESAFFKWWDSFAGKRVGFDADTTSYAEFEALEALPLEIIPLRGPIKLLRAVKDPSEIEKLKFAAELGSKGFDYVCTLLREGISEREVALELEMFWLKAGGEKLSFAPHIAFGEGSSQPHYHSSSRKLRKGDLVLIDIGVVVDHYHSDMTRVLSFGPPSDEMQKVYAVVYEAAQKAVKLCKPGVKIGDVDRAARQFIEDKGYKDKFPHSLGHGVGLEIHELPRLRASGADGECLLEKGMVITIEPGIYLPGAFGVRLEDALVITEQGHENITNRPLPPKLPLV